MSEIVVATPIIFIGYGQACWILGDHEGQGLKNMELESGMWMFFKNTAGFSINTNHETPSV